MLDARENHLCDAFGQLVLSDDLDLKAGITDICEGHYGVQTWQVLAILPPSDVVLSNRLAEEGCDSFRQRGPG